MSTNMFCFSSNFPTFKYERKKMYLLLSHKMMFSLPSLKKYKEIKIDEEKCFNNSLAQFKHSMLLLFVDITTTPSKENFVHQPHFPTENIYFSCLWIILSKVPLFSSQRFFVTLIILVFFTKRKNDSQEQLCHCLMPQNVFPERTL